MPTVHLDLADRSYDILVEDGLLDSIGSLVQSTGLKGKCALITDSNVGPLYAQRVMDSLDEAGISSSCHTFPAGEASKSMSQSSALCSELINAGHDRASFVLALGGGVTGDLAGFVAAIFYRGVPFVQVPTTIVSQVDSSAGGKTGVNAPEGKNLIGAFHQPRLVVVDPMTLATLPGREYREGYAEAIKHAAIRDEAMIDDLNALDPSDQHPSADLLARNLAIKARVVEEDERETSGTRALLNFGHTVGHGIEASLPYGEMLHGEAISLGTRAALILSEQLNGFPRADSQRILQFLEAFQLPLVLSDHIETDTIMDKLLRDKKFSGGTIHFVLLTKAGSAEVSDQVTLDDIRNAIEQLRTPVDSDPTRG
ncbi:3-dehydroquinate synthase [Verrucomicrobiaceae bacterium N1E253]|uniref:3-dehydroquinate synthase n=1 Tax=Oceaniferula marina TaxID=2748318 RepID=A0A851GH14_9BACT|nr:3-dehydroquinate synthase [Oceaniferula marina]NWK56656.1 3-dehydroquinate synthase [Oceaniferula marina]